MEDGVILAVPTQKGTCGIWNCLPLDENQRISVLAGLSWSLLERIHKLTSTTHAETLFWSSEASEGAVNAVNSMTLWILLLPTSVLRRIPAVSEKEPIVLNIYSYSFKRCLLLMSFCFDACDFRTMITQRSCWALRVGVGD